MTPIIEKTMAQYHKNGRMRIQSSHSFNERGHDAYFSPYEAVWPLIDLEPNMPRRIWEPCAGNGRIVRPLQQHGFKVLSSDLIDYRVRDIQIQTGVNYLEAVKPDGIGGIVTNPPYKIAKEFIVKALEEVPYSAWLLRINFLEAEGRIELFRQNPPARVWISSRRLPMMHRLGWDGPIAPSNSCHAWFVWDESTPMKDRQKFGWFDWKDHYEELESEY